MPALLKYDPGTLKLVYNTGTKILGMCDCTAHGCNHCETTGPDQIGVAITGGAWADPYSCKTLRLNGPGISLALDKVDFDGCLYAGWNTPYPDCGGDTKGDEISVEFDAGADDSHIHITVAVIYKLYQYQTDCGDTGEGGPGVCDPYSTLSGCTQAAIAFSYDWEQPLAPCVPCVGDFGFTKSVSVAFPSAMSPDGTDYTPSTWVLYCPCSTEWTVWFEQGETGACPPDCSPTIGCARDAAPPTFLDCCLCETSINHYSNVCGLDAVVCDLAPTPGTSSQGGTPGCPPILYGSLSITVIL